MKNNQCKIFSLLLTLCILIQSISVFAETKSSEEQIQQSKVLLEFLEYKDLNNYPEIEKFMKNQEFDIHSHLIEERAKELSLNIDNYIDIVTKMI